jgi:hypothetical protein
VIGFIFRIIPTQTQIIQCRLPGAAYQTTKNEPDHRQRLCLPNILTNMLLMASWLSLNFLRYSATTSKVIFFFGCGAIDEET